MGIGNVALNFIKGNFVKSLLCRKSSKIHPKSSGLKYNLTHVIHTRNAPTVLNIKTGKREEIIIDQIGRIRDNGNPLDLQAYNALGDVIGLVRLKDTPNNNVLRMLG